jgi:hypothetical protein
MRSRASRKKAKSYQEALSRYARLEWVLSTKEELEVLIKDLREYNDELINLTQSSFHGESTDAISQGLMLLLIRK